MSDVRARAPRISRPHDARVVRSRDALREALLALIEQKPFEQISIKDITNSAGLSYPVFFRQFEGKEDLLADIATGEVEHLLESAERLFDRSRMSGGNMLHYVQEHRVLWRALLTAGAASIMRQEFIRIARQIATSRERQNPQLPLDLATNLTAAGMFEVLAWWLTQPEDYPIENVATILDSLIVRPITTPIKLKPV